MLPQDCELQCHVALKPLYHLPAQALLPPGQRDVVPVSKRSCSSIVPTHASGPSARHAAAVAIAQALLGKPDLVLLDEPTSGLDPELVVRMRDVFASHRKKRTLVVSSHNLLELEALCDHVIFIDRGRCTQSGSMAEVTEQGLIMRYTVERAVDLAQLLVTHPARDELGE
jgi:ABC-type Na+ transport system ATPase subunit NatA